MPRTSLAPFALLLLFLPAHASAAYTFEASANRPGLELPQGYSVLVAPGNGVTVTYRVLEDGEAVPHAQLRATLDGAVVGSGATNGAGERAFGFYNGATAAAKTARVELECVLQGDVCAPATAPAHTLRVLWTEAAVGLSAPASATTGTAVEVVAFVNWTADGNGVPGVRVRLVVDGVEAFATTGTDGRATFQVAQTVPRTRTLQAGVLADDAPAGIPTQPSALRTIQFVAPTSSSSPDGGESAGGEGGGGGSPSSPAATTTATSKAPVSQPPTVPTEASVITLPGGGAVTVPPGEELVVVGDETTTPSNGTPFAPLALVIVILLLSSLRKKVLP